MAEMLTSEEVARLAAPDEPAPELTPEEVQRLAAPPSPLQRTQALGRSLLRGAQTAGEFVGDVADIGPLNQVLSATLSGEPLSSTPFAQSYEAARGEGSGRPMALLKALGGGFTRESAGDRLRDQAHQVLNLRTQRQIPPTGEPLFEGANTAMEFMGGAAVGGPVGALPRAGAKLAARLSPAAIGALGAGGGRAAAELADLGEGGTLLSELGGATLAVLSRNVSSMPAYADKLTRMFRSGRMTDATRRRALQVLETQADNPEAALRQIKSDLAGERVGSLAALSDDPGLRTTAKTFPFDPAAKQNIATAQQRGAEQAVGEFADVAAAGVPARAAAAPLARTQAAQERARALQGAQTTRGQAGAAEAADRLTAYPSVEDAGTAVRDAVEGAQRVAKQVEEASWALVPADDMLSTAPVKAALTGFLDEMTPTARRGFERSFSTIIDDVDALDVRATGVELNDLRGAVSDAISAASREMPGASSRADRFATRLAEVIKGTIDDAPGGEAFKRARAASRDRFETFTEGPLGKARKAAARAGAPATMGERLTPRGTQGGPAVEAAKRADEFTPAGEVAGELTDSLMAQFREAANPGGAGFSAAKAQSWLNSRKAVLDRFPEVRDQAEQTIAAAKRGAGTAQSAATTAALRSKAIAESPAARFAGKGAERGDVAARSIINGRNPASDTRQLRRTAERAGGSALVDMKAAYRKAVLDDLIGSKGSMGKRAKRRYESRRAALDELFDAGEMTRLDSAVDFADRLAGGRTGTAKPLEEESHNLFVNMVRILGAKVGAKASGQPLIAAGIASSEAKKRLSKMPRQDLITAVGEYMANPQAYVDDLAKFGALPEPGVREFLRQMFPVAMGATTTGEN